MTSNFRVQSYKMIIFGLKNERCSRILYFEIQQAPSELLLPDAKTLPKKADLAWQVSRGFLKLKF